MSVRNRNELRMAVWIAAAMSALLAGCAQRECVEEWTPSPAVRWEHVAASPESPVENGYRLHLEHPTHGLFPASIGVTRVAIHDPIIATGEAYPHLLADPRNEFLQWNSALDDQMAVSEVFPIIDRDLGGGVATPDQILAACRGLRANIGLIYAVNEESRNETEMFGALYDTDTSVKLASLHASAISVQPPEDAPDDAPVDLWETDSRALVRERFELILRSCLRDLILQDEPAEVVAPTGWTPAGPILPVEWPPHQLRTGR